MTNFKVKFIDAGFGEKSKNSYAIVELGKKRYSATVTLAKEDEDKVSKLRGPRFAEMKAEIRALKGQLRIEKEKCNECRNFVKALECYKEFDKKTKTARCVYRQLNRRINNVNVLIAMINQKQQDYVTAVHQSDIVTKAIERKKERDAKES